MKKEMEKEQEGSGDLSKEEPKKMRIRVWDKRKNRFVGPTYDSIMRCEQIIRDYGVVDKLEARLYKGEK